MDFELKEFKKSAEDKSFPLPKGIAKPAEAYMGMEHDYRVLDSMNIRAADDLVFSLAMRKRLSMNENGRLFIIMGEKHTLPSHLMLQLGLAENFNRAAQKYPNNKSFKTTYVQEYPHNNLADFTLDYLGESKTSEKRFALHKQINDPLGHIFARAAPVFDKKEIGPANAPVTKLRAYDMVLRNNMPYILADISNIPRLLEAPIIDYNDPLAQEIAKVDLSKESVSIISLDGMKLRNAVMAERINAGADEHKSKTVIIGTGRDHLGNYARELPFEDSLPKSLSKKLKPEDHIITIYPATNDVGYEGPVREIFAEENITTIRIEGLSEKRFKYEVTSEEDENDFIKELSESYNSSAIPPRFLPPLEPSAEQVRQVESYIKTAATLALSA